MSFITYEDAERIVRDRLDDITVDDNSRCHWAEVANALTHILGELRAATSAPEDISGPAAKAGFDAGWAAALEEAALLADAYHEEVWGNAAEECAAEQIARQIREFAVKSVPTPRELANVPRTEGD